MNKILFPRLMATLVTLLCLSTMQFWAATYSWPASYARSDSYRTGKPERKAVEIVNNRRLDSVRRSVPQNYIGQVCTEISSYTSNEFLRVKLIHDVTALLLFYDDANYWSNSVPQQTLSHVLQTRKAVCEGYANLFQALCNEIGVSCEKVHGYARGVSASERGYEDPTDSNHAWNMVQIQGDWYLVDCTWDSGHMSGRTSVQEYNTTWLFVQPEHMIYSHFPSQQSHQLLEYPLTPQEFTRLPNLRPTLFYSAALHELPERENSVEGISILNYQVKPGSNLRFYIKDTSSDSSISNSVFYEQNPQTGGTTVFFSPPNPGTYRVNVFDTQGEYCGHFFITTTAPRPSHTNLASKEERQAFLGSGSYSSFSPNNSPLAIARARSAPQNNATPGGYRSSPAGRTTTTRPAPSQPDFDGQHVISLGYTFPTDLAKDKNFSAGSKDNFAISVSWEDSDHKQFPGILALSYRRRQVQEEGSSRQTGSTYYRTNQEWVQETRTLTYHTLMLEGSLGWKLIPHVLCYAGAGIGLSYIPENKEHGSGPIAKNVPWQVQVGTRVNLMDLLYIRVQTAYLHTGEFLPSLHLGLSLF